MSAARTAQAGQLPLPFVHAPDYAPADFLRGPCNEAALDWLARPGEWPEGRLAIRGEAGSGKTHLLHVWASGSGASLARGPGLDWQSLLGGKGPIGLDEADAAPERALLHLINAAAEWRRPLVLTGRTAPGRWPVSLPDLSSRLRAMADIELRGPEDEMLAPLFARLLAERQIAVSAPLQSWLLLRLPRSPAALRDAAGRIDRALLASGGRMNHALACAVVESIGGEPRI